MMSGPSPSPVLFPERPNSNRQWSCNECSHIFSLSRLLETHAVETNHKAYRCTKEKGCGKLFTLRPSWVRHEGSHSAQKSHACSRCLKKFRRRDNLHDHQRTCGRVTRRATLPLQVVSTTSATTRSDTPMDLLTTTVDDEKLRHQAESGNDGSRPFDTSNGNPVGLQGTQCANRCTFEFYGHMFLNAKRHDSTTSHSRPP
jgi:uncharacterized Zn-finger protein